jgi:hypothetical protein
VFIKIDFGKTKYRPEDIARWNALKLPNSVALFPDKTRFRSLDIHNGVELPDWILDGAKQFRVSCRRFDVFEWLNHGRVGLSAGYACRQMMFLERSHGARCASFLARSGGLFSRCVRRALFKK